MTEFKHFNDMKKSIVEQSKFYGACALEDIDKDKKYILFKIRADVMELKTTKIDESGALLFNLSDYINVKQSAAKILTAIFFKLLEEIDRINCSELEDLLSSTSTNDRPNVLAKKLIESSKNSVVEVLEKIILLADIEKSESLNIISDESICIHAKINQVASSRNIEAVLLKTIKLFWSNVMKSIVRTLALFIFNKYEAIGEDIIIRILDMGGCSEQLKLKIKGHIVEQPPKKV